MTLEEQARIVWDTIRSNLEDRSVLEMGSVDEDLIAEIEAEQIEAIAAAFRPVSE